MNEVVYVFVRPQRDPWLYPCDVLAEAAIERMFVSDGITTDVPDEEPTQTQEVVT